MPEVCYRFLTLKELKEILDKESERSYLAYENRDYIMKKAKKSKFIILKTESKHYSEFLVKNSLTTKTRVSILELPFDVFAIDDFTEILLHY